MGRILKKFKEEIVVKTKKMNRICFKRELVATKEMNNKHINKCSKYINKIKPECHADTTENNFPYCFLMLRKYKHKKMGRCIVKEYYFM